VPQYPNLGIEKEFAQLSVGPDARSGSLLETDRLIAVLRDPNNEYLAQQLCWVFVAGDVEVFSLACPDHRTAFTLVEALPTADEATQTVQVVIGSIGPPVAGTPCAGSGLPSVWMDHHLTFPLDQFVDAMAREGQQASEQEKVADNRRIAQDLFLRLTRRTDNRGLTDEHRALNYLATRYPPIYRFTADAYADNKVLAGIDFRRAPTTGRRVVAVRLIFRDRRNEAIERHQCLVDVHDRFPFLGSPLGPVYD